MLLSESEDEENAIHYMKGVFINAMVPNTLLDGQNGMFTGVEQWINGLVGR